VCKERKRGNIWSSRAFQGERFVDKLSVVARVIVGT
jgi:hypothetical protein